MSLDVYLRTPEKKHPIGGSGIFIRQDGATRQITREEWDAQYPGRDPATLLVIQETDKAYSANITHNLGKMADAAGIYKPLWRPDEIGITKAAQLIAPLARGLAILIESPDRFRHLNPTNGWGSYDGLVRFVSGYLAACAENPQAEVTVSR